MLEIKHYGATNGHGFGDSMWHVQYKFPGEDVADVPFDNAMEADAWRARVIQDGAEWAQIIKPTPTAPTRTTPIPTPTAPTRTTLTPTAPAPTPAGTDWKKIGIIGGGIAGGLLVLGVAYKLIKG